LQAFPASLIAAWLILRVWWEDDWAPGTLSLRRGYA